MQEQKGWIKLYRCFRDNVFYNNPNANVLWNECLLRASHSDKQFFWKREMIKLKAGEFIFGEAEIGAIFGLSRQTARYHLNAFVLANMLDIKRTSKGSIGKVKNWEKYQSVDSSVDNKKTALYTTKRHLQECKEIKKKNSGKKIDIFLSILFQNNLLTEKQMQEITYEECDDQGFSIKEIKRAKAKKRASAIQTLIDNGKTVADIRDVVRKSGNRTAHIVSLYWDKVEMDFEDVHQLYADFQRNLKPATVLKSYSDEKILKTMEYLDTQEWLADWTLETVVKKIAKIETLTNKEEEFLAPIEI